MWGGGGELLPCPYQPKVHARPSRDQRRLAGIGLNCLFRSGPSKMRDSKRGATFVGFVL